MKKIYLNRKQQEFLDAAQKTKTGIWGRGTGKTTIIADHIVDFIHQMPRSKGALLMKTFGQAYTKALPEIFDRQAEYGFQEHMSMAEPGHFVVCKTPPKWWGKPFKQPRKYDNTITYINGTMFDLLSFDRPDLSRGGSYDWLIVDEAALINYDQFKKTVRPLLRGNTRKWNHPKRFTLIIFTSRAWKPSGKWTETIMKQLAAEHPDMYFYSEASAEENLEVLGADYFDRMKLEMDPLTYSVEILNKPISKLPNAFYEFLDEDKHTYEPEYTYNYEDDSWQISEENDVRSDLPLEPSFDFNAKFTSATIWQDLRPADNKLRMLRNFYVKYTNIEVLIDNICDHYTNHPTKIVNIYGGKDGLSKFKLHNDLTIYDRIMQKFHSRGWHAILCVDVSLADVAHKLKYLVINNVLRGTNPELPTVEINAQSGKETFISMLNSPIRGDFEKDKSSESDNNVDQEFATHLSDTFDNYVYPKTRHIEANQSNEQQNLFAPMSI
jgi:hypothetical protein